MIKYETGKQLLLIEHSRLNQMNSLIPCLLKVILHCLHTDKEMRQKMVICIRVLKFMLLRHVFSRCEYTLFFNISILILNKFIVKFMNILIFEILLI